MSTRLKNIVVQVSFLDYEIQMSAPDTRDYFAELYVAGIFGDAGWSVYFPKRDVGFDFIVSKSVDDEILIKP